MKKPWLIDREALMECLNKELDFCIKEKFNEKNSRFYLGRETMLTDMIGHIQSGRFDSPSDSDRLRGALEALMRRLEHDPNHVDSYEYTKAAQALSTTTEPTEAERVRECPACGHDLKPTGWNDSLGCDNCGYSGVPGINIPDKEAAT